MLCHRSQLQNHGTPMHCNKANHTLMHNATHCILFYEQNGPWGPQVHYWTLTQHRDSDDPGRNLQERAGKLATLQYLSLLDGVHLTCVDWGLKELEKTSKLTMRFWWEMRCRTTKLKWTVHPKMKIIPLFTPPEVILDAYDFPLSVKRNQSYIK